MDTNQLLSSDLPSLHLLMQVDTPTPATHSGPSMPSMSSYGCSFKCPGNYLVCSDPPQGASFLDPASMSLQFVSGLGCVTLRALPFQKSRRDRV